MKYSLLKEDDKAFHLMHPDGETFQVAKKGIDESVHERIRKMIPRYMAEGGKVLPAESIAQTAADSEQVPLGDVENVNPKVPLPYGQTGNEVVMGPPEVTKPVVADNSQGEPALAKPVSVEDSNKIPLQDIPAPKERVPTDPFSLEERGVKEQAQAEKQLGQQSAQAYQQGQTDLANDHAIYQSKMDELNRRDAQLSAAYENGHIDPNRVISNMSTGNKVMAGIGLILGGLGGGALGTGQNDALKTLNGIVDRDIDAQKSELDKGRNLLSQNFERTHNLETAHLMTKNDILGALEVNIKGMAANAASPMAQGKADMLLGQIAQQRMQNNMAMAQKMLALQLSGGTSQGFNPELIQDEKLRERVVKIPGGGVGLANTGKDAEDVRKSLTSLQTLDKQIDDSIKFMNQTGRTAGAELPLVGHVGSSADSVASNMRNSIVVELNKLHDLNRLNPQELKIFESMVPSPGAWRQDKAAAMLMSLRNFIQNKRASELTNHLSNYKEPVIQSQKKGFAS